MLSGIHLGTVSQTDMLYVGIKWGLTDYGLWLRSVLLPVFVSYIYWNTATLYCVLSLTAFVLQRQE